MNIDLNHDSTQSRSSLFTGYGSDYEDESSRYPVASNGMIPGTGFGPDSDRIHRDSPPNSYNQQIVPGNHSNTMEQPSFDEWDDFV